MPRKPTIKSLTNKADRLTSYFVRQLYADEHGVVSCCTCGLRKHWREVDCGHYKSRRHKSTRWALTNLGPQCKGCNAFGKVRLSSTPGEPAYFRKWLVKTWGEEEVEKIEQLATETWKPTIGELETLTGELKKALKLKRFDLPK